MGYLWDIYGSSMGHLHYDGDMMWLSGLRHSSEKSNLKSPECSESG